MLGKGTLELVENLGPDYYSRLLMVQKVIGVGVLETSHRMFNVSSPLNYYNEF